ncbi:hypothetical protein SELSPUOL_01718 [Selenomonas sputigena ATCC 35185]|uniref:Uncharacterized protein n=1 Tax=Selenomonas sputigena (strain ATCC 35185 / DSM 20758 / CCUG 44933 / VPI D19B-28) TaxID=546271 RepID=C9LW64_SELS3|nr:hypothetical protein SELSPUOL_01718 [Selenomonas sputigena ATCC 35185]
MLNPFMPYTVQSAPPCIREHLMQRTRLRVADLVELSRAIPALTQSTDGLRKGAASMSARKNVAAHVVMEKSCTLSDSIAVASKVADDVNML